MNRRKIVTLVALALLVAVLIVIPSAYTGNNIPWQQPFPFQGIIDAVLAFFATWAPRFS